MALELPNVGTPVREPTFIDPAQIIIDLKTKYVRPPLPPKLALCPHNAVSPRVMKPHSVVHLEYSPLRFRKILERCCETPASRKDASTGLRVQVARGLERRLSQNCRHKLSLFCDFTWLNMEASPKICGAPITQEHGRCHSPNR
jgi:hypothetical protein